MEGEEQRAKLFAADERCAQLSERINVRAKKSNSYDLF